MKIAVWNGKGGVGKTPLAFSLAKDLDYPYITNDDTHLLQKYSKSAFETKPKIYKKAVYDFGGFTSNILHVIKDADIVIIPTNPDNMSIYKTIKTYEEVIKYNNNIIVIIGDWTDIKEYNETADILKSKMDVNLDDVYPMKRSNLYKNVHNIFLSFREQHKKRPWTFKTTIEQYNNILKRIKGEKNA